MSALRLRIFIIAALLAAAVFVRLGFWQLHRRGERRTWNALVRARLDSSEIDVQLAPRDTGRMRYRRVRVHGVPDFDHELVLAARTHQGSPGVNLITPIRLAGSDTAVIVNRGWVYSPDGATVDLGRWRTDDTVYTGFIDDLPAKGGSTFKDRPRVISRLSAGALAAALPYPIAPFYVVVFGDSALAADRPVRLGTPPLDEGPHLSYAIQWFAFALVAVGGGAAVLAKQSRRRD